MSNTTHNRHSGAEWIKATYCKDVEMSPLGVQVADLLGYLYAGIYHLNRTSLSKVDWTNPTHIQVTVYGGLATYDGQELTRLVFLAHAMCLRVEVDAAARNYLRLIFHPRQRDGGNWQRHPTLDQALATFREYYGFLEESAEQVEVAA